MPIHEHVHTLVDAVAPVVTRVPDQALEDATPCTEFDVRTLANHLLGTVEAMRRIGAGEDLDADDPWGTGGDHMHDGWRDDLTARLSGFADAWDSPDAFEGEAMGGTMPKQMIGAMAFAEVVLHGWDLARATGQDDTIDPNLLAPLGDWFADRAASYRSSGAIGPRPELPDDAGPQAVLLADFGRAS